MAADGAAALLRRDYKFLFETGFTFVTFSATGFLLLPFRDPGHMLHLLFFYVTALVGFSLLFLSSTIHKFATAAKATATVADAIARVRFRLLRLLISKRGLDGRSLSTLYCSVWCAATLAYAIAKVSLCYHGLAWMSYVLFYMN